MGTGIMYLTGAMDEATKTITLKGFAYDAMNKKDMNYKQVMRFIDKDHYVMEMYTDVDGKEMKTMEIQYTRM